MKEIDIEDFKKDPLATLEQSVGEPVRIVCETLRGSCLVTFRPATRSAHISWAHDETPSDFFVVDAVSLGALIIRLTVYFVKEFRDIHMAAVARVLDVRQELGVSNERFSMDLVGKLRALGTMTDQANLLESENNAVLEFWIPQTQVRHLNLEEKRG